MVRVSSLNMEEAPVALDRTRWCNSWWDWLPPTLERLEVLEVARGDDGRLYVVVETTERLVACAGCGMRAALEDRPRVPLADLPAFGSPVVLVWVKRRWDCPRCGAGSWTEYRPDIVPGEG